MRSQVFASNWGKIRKKKLLSIILNSISSILKKEILGKFQVDLYNICTIGIDIMRFHIDIFSELILTIILYLFLLYSF